MRYAAICRRFHFILGHADFNLCRAVFADLYIEAAKRLY